MRPLSRRSLITGGPIGLSACATAKGGWFGRTDPPDVQRLVYLIGGEPASLDPAKSTDLWELYIVHSLFEGLTTLHPLTCEPMAGLATHYRVASDGLRYTFFLRGHPRPGGRKLPNTNDLSRQISRGLPVAAPARASQWSDGSVITAADVIYSWRRAVDPSTAAALSYQLSYIRYAEEIGAGNRRPEELGAWASDDFTVEVALRSSAPFFLQLISNRVFCPVPRQAIQKYGDAWAEPGRMITSGPFVLASRRPNDSIVLTRNPFYYEAKVVTLSELEFVTVVDGTANVNLYKAGDAGAIQTYLPSLMPALSRKRDFRSYTSFGTIFPVFNTTNPPMNDVRVRYALNMGTDKRALADFMGVGRTPARTLVPPVEGYQPIRSLPLTFNGTECDVLAFNPRAARELLRSAIGPGPVRLEFLSPNLPEARPAAEVIQHQWKETLDVELVLLTQELQTWIQSIYSRSYRHIGSWADYGGHTDPVWFLDSFSSGSAANPTPWRDSKYDSLLSEAAATTISAARLRNLADAEGHLMRAMPFLPLYCDVWVYMCKPYVKGLGENPLDRQQFKYAWIDTNWRPSS